MISLTATGRYDGFCRRHLRLLEMSFLCIRLIYFSMYFQQRYALLLIAVSAFLGNAFFCYGFCAALRPFSRVDYFLAAARFLFDQTMVAGLFAISRVSASREARTVNTGAFILRASLSFFEVSMSRRSFLSHHRHAAFKRYFLFDISPRIRDRAHIAVKIYHLRQTSFDTEQRVRSVEEISRTRSRRDYRLQIAERRVSLRRFSS